MPNRLVQQAGHLDDPPRDTSGTQVVTPIKGLQAMALGLPLVVSNLPALCEIGSDEGQGLAVPAEDPVAFAGAFQRIAEDPDLAASLSAASRVAARGRTWSANGRKYAGIYAGLVGR
jgi:D-inositol-3-phosphate glycosyltransferase